MASQINYKLQGRFCRGGVNMIGAVDAVGVRRSRGSRRIRQRLGSTRGPRPSKVVPLFRLRSCPPRVGHVHQFREEIRVCGYILLGDPQPIHAKPVVQRF